jgi:leader peptidase (prepilin peptidase) / N-methyltransferase
MQTALLIPFSFLFGASMGSFLNVCIVRIPQGESIVAPRSHCPRCGHLIRWYDNIPLLSFFILGGRCRDCRGKISRQYPWVEFLTGLLAVACAWKFPHLEIAALWFVSFICPLIVISVIDLRHFLVPDLITLPFLLIGMIVRMISTGFQYHSVSSLLDSLMGILIGGGGLFLVNQIYVWIQKREGIGGGDVKLAAMIGAFLGWKAILIVFVLSSFLGSMVGILLMIFRGLGLRSEIPYGPFLSLAALIQLFFGSSLLHAYFHWVQKFTK